MQTKTYSEIMQGLRNTFFANQHKVSDFSEGSVIHTIFMSVARQLEALYLSARNGYKSNLKALAYSIFGLERKEGTHAMCSVVFYVNEEKDTPTVIVAGTLVSDGAMVFETAKDATIMVGEKASNAVVAVARKSGTGGNVRRGAVNKIESITCTADRVENVSEGSGGSDRESDKEYEARFKMFLNGLQGNNSYAMREAVLAVDGVRSVSIAEHFPPQNNFNATIYVDDGHGTMTPSLHETVREVVEANKSVGVKIKIESAKSVRLAVSVDCHIVNKEVEVAKKEVEETIKNYINSLGIGEDVILTTIIHALRGLYYVKDVKGLKIALVSEGGGAGSETAVQWNTDNYTIDTPQIARFYEKGNEGAELNAINIQGYTRT